MSNQVKQRLACCCTALEMARSLINFQSHAPIQRARVVGLLHLLGGVLIGECDPFSLYGS